MGSSKSNSPCLLRSMLCRANSNQPRDSRSRMLVVRVDSVRPAPGLQPEVEELRLKVGGVRT
jgi:hypothetical protein